jgi:hypothetical protein
VLQAPEIIASVFVRKHLGHILGSPTSGIVDLNPCVSSLRLPETCHSLRGRYVLVLKKSVEVQWNLWFAITRPSLFIYPNPTLTIETSVYDYAEEPQ